MKAHRSFRTVTSALLLALATAAAPAAFAKRISIDFQEGSDPPFGNGTGLSFPLTCLAAHTDGNSSNSCSIDLSANPSLEVALGFDIDIGGTIRSSLFINKNGLVTFGNAPAEPTAASFGSFAALQTELGGTSFIAPSYADLPTSNAGNIFGIYDAAPGVYYQRGLGLLDYIPPVFPDPLVIDPTKVTNAFSVIWSSNIGTEKFISQLLLYSLANNGVEMHFNYGIGADNPAGVFGGYSLGDASESWTDTFSETDRSSSFPTDTGGPVTVPEPGTLALFLMGLLGLLGLRHAGAGFAGQPRKA